MARIGTIFVALLFVAPALAKDGIPGELKACRAERDDRARLACFDAAIGKLEAAVPTFGGEALQRRDAPPQEPAMLAARVAGVTFNAFRHFTLVLDNGQVWRQLDSDTGTPRFRVGDAIQIKQGFMDGFSLTTEGGYGLYKVKRIK